ncbi:prolyl oligopeptidase family serine peptidase, partial [Aquicoccus sp. SCR17]|nr:prolyl oligopeptidase family serine peptidase [Carideicomes alvinocaridis]
VEGVWYKSSADGRDIQGWVVYPPNYDPNKKYPFMVENHGGPIANYGDRFSTEMQLFAAAGYVVFYPNPRGSTSYGEEFGNLLYNNYPGELPAMWFFIPTQEEVPAMVRNSGIYCTTIILE